MQVIDLRSDTVTWPTPAMRQAMAHADVGDDVYGDDPTVNALEAEAAALLGKEAGLFVSSGTQGNLTAVLTHCQRGEKLILGQQAHIFRYEAGGAASLGGLVYHTLPVQPDGTLDLDEISAAIPSAENVHYARPRLICLENTQGTIGGIPINAAYTAQVGALAHQHGLRLHIDGARLFNAATALHTSARELVAAADSVSICLSKGLCAPVGSVLVGSADFIYEARRVRKVLGGGMRQAGILAAAGRLALQEMTTRLHEDHANARALANGLAQIPHIQLDLERVQTNMVFFDIAPDAPLSAAELCQRLKDEYAILINPLYTHRIRAVLHYWITPQRVETTLKAIRTLLS